MQNIRNKMLDSNIRYEENDICGSKMMYQIRIINILTNLIIEIISINITNNMNISYDL